MEDVMLKGSATCYKLINDGDALVGMCEKNEKLWLNMTIHSRIVIVYACCKVINFHCL